MRLTRIAAAVALLAGCLSCDDTKVEPLAKQVAGLDDRLTLRGRVCTKPPDPDGFPVKVLFLIDKSGSMCVTDPPGSQSNFNGLCEKFNLTFSDPNYRPPNNFCEPDGNAHPGRVCAIYQLLDQFRGKPNVEVALVPFETKISGDYPTTSDFERVDGSNFNTWVNRVNDMQGSLGQGTDIQGAFAEAYRRIADDIVNLPKAKRPRTRYVVVFLTDGTPFPRCAGNDLLPPQDYGNYSNPDGIWPDSPGAGCPAAPDTNDCFCNADQTYLEQHPLGSNYATGTDRNQNYQIYDVVDRLLALKDQYDVADIRVHSILLWNFGNIATLGPSEQADLFGDLSAAPDPVVAAHDVAAHLLRQISEVHGNGTYQEFQQVANIQLGALDYTSLASPFVLKNLLVENVSARPALNGAEPDSDGDGLPDGVDNNFTAGTNRFITDSDKDGFDDQFEWTHKGQGFSPNNDPDPRGCKDTPLHRATCACEDTDGDGLSACAEEYLHTDSTLLDSDADAVPDGMEVSYGLDPSVRDSPIKDSDGDGTPDLEELRQHSDPIVADTAFQAKEGYRYEIKAVDVDGGVVCYDFEVSNIKLVTPQSQGGGQQGYNVVKLFFDQAPKANVTGDYGEWTEACAIAQYAPPSLRVPAGPEMQIKDDDFKDPGQITPDRYDTECVQAQ